MEEQNNFNIKYYAQNEKAKERRGGEEGTATSTVEVGGCALADIPRTRWLSGEDAGLVRFGLAVSRVCTSHCFLSLYMRFFAIFIL